MNVKKMVDTLKSFFLKKAPSLPTPTMQSPCLQKSHSDFCNELKNQTIAKDISNVSDFNTLDGAIEQYIMSYLMVAENGCPDSYKALTNIGGKEEIHNRRRSFY